MKVNKPSTSKKYYNRFYYPRAGLVVNPADRFVFFRSLDKRSPQLGAAASSVLTSGAAFELGYSPTGYTATKEIKLMLDKFKQIIQTEQKNEMAFLQNKILENKSFSKFKKVYKKLTESLSSSDKLDYLTFINTLNLILSGEKFFIKNLENEQSRIKEIEARTKKFLQKKGTKGRERFVNDYTFSHKNYQELIHSLDDTPIQETLTKQFEAKTQRILNHLCSDPDAYEAMVNAVRTAIKKNIFPTDAIKEYIVPLVVKAVMDDVDFKISQEKLIEQLLPMTKNASGLVKNKRFTGGKFLKTSQNEELVKVLKNKSAKGVYQATRRGGSLNTLYTRFLNSDFSKEANAKTIEDLKERIKRIEGDIFQIEELIKNGTKIGAYSLTRVPNQELRISKNGKLAKSSPEEYLARVKQNFSREFKKTILELERVRKQEIQDWIAQNIRDSGVKLEGDIMAEIMSAVRQSTTSALTHSSWQGSLNRKNDVGSIVITPRLSTPFTSKATEQKVKQIVFSFNEKLSENQTLLRKQQDIGFNETNTKIEADAYRLTLKEMQDLINTMLTDSQDLAAAAELLKKSVVINESVKNYESYNNLIGFGGGSLGGSDNAIKGIENIYKMFESGGISPVDKDWLIFAVLNSSRKSYGYNLRNPIGNYLAFMAAMMMFEYSEEEIEQASSHYLANIESSGPHTLNLYYVNGFYFPSSFVLNLIYEGLMKTYGLIEQTAFKSNGGKVIIKNTISYHHVLGTRPTKSSADWQKVSSTAQSETQIRFTFLAGLLDIMDQLENNLKNLVS